MVKILVSIADWLHDLYCTVVITIGLALNYEEFADAYIRGYARGGAKGYVESLAKKRAETTGQPYESVYPRAHAEEHAGAYAWARAWALEEVRADPGLLKRNLQEAMLRRNKRNQRD